MSDGQREERADLASRRRGDPWTEDAIYAHLPPDDPGAKHVWWGYPGEDEAYEQYVRDLLTFATATQVAPPESVEYHRGHTLDVCGAPVATYGDGGVLPITNAVVDYASREEGSSMHAGRSGLQAGGWTDPNLRGIGSASRADVPAMILQEQPCRVVLHFRALSFVTVDHPTYSRTDDTFYEEVVDRLVRTLPQNDRLYGWLAVMCGYCAGKPLAYFSAYPPSTTIHKLAWRFGVRVVHRPRSVIPEALLRKHRTFRLLNLTKVQWEALNARRCGERSTGTTV